MRTLIKKNRSRLIAAAMGKIPCDLSIENARIVNTLTGEILEGSIDILDGVLVRVRYKGVKSDLEAREVVQADGMYLLPGFIDSHMHVESSLLIPENFGKAAITWGTTMAITDPHEIANVSGQSGVKYMIENAKRSPLRIFTLIPSCVPSMPDFESAGAFFSAEDVRYLLQEDGVLGIAEVMDFGGLLLDDSRMHDIIALGDELGCFIQGHAPELTDASLDAYIVGGPISDHESVTAEEVLEKRRKGLYVDLRVHNVEEAKELIQGLEPGDYLDLVSLCTDDVNAYKLQEEGHINASVAHLIDAGMSAIQAVKLATLNAAREYGYKDLGAIAPGYVADIQLVHDLSFKKKPALVYVGGHLLTRDGEFIGDSSQKSQGFLKNTVDVKCVSEINDFLLPAKDGKCPLVMVVNEGYKEKKIIREELELKDGYGLIPDSKRKNLNYICVLNRYGLDHKTIALYRGFGLKKGALASTISHDCHNIYMVYENPHDAYIALQTLKESNGGVCYVKDASVVAILPLPVAGLMSDLPLAETASACHRLESVIARESQLTGFTLYDLIFETLPVFERYTATDMGIVNGPYGGFVEAVIYD